MRQTKECKKKKNISLLFELGERSSEAKAGLSSIELYLQARWDIS